MKFHAFYSASGEIVLTATLQDDVAPTLLSPLPSVETSIAVGVDTHWIGTDAEGPELRSYTEDGAARKRQHPGVGFEWNPATEQWVDGRSLVEHRAARWAVLKAQRDVLERSGFEWDGSTFDSDLVSQSRIQGAAQLATLAKIGSQPFSITWTLADNTTRALDADEMIAVGMAMGMHINALIAQSRALRDAIEAATTIEEVQEISW